jgi:hypothetical protein
MLDIIFRIADGAFRTATRRGKKGQILYGTALLCIFAGFPAAILTSERNPSKEPHPVALALLTVGTLYVLYLAAVDHSRKYQKQIEEVETAEQRVRENPQEPQAAWDLARIKLEGYIDRNLKQVGQIFFLCVASMLAGFGLIGYGVWRAFEGPQNLDAAIVAASSGVLVEFVSATFLVIYRSTIRQAQSYVTMLEKINAVGMSIHILEKMPGTAAESARLELALRLLSLYSPEQRKDPAKSRSAGEE